MQEEVAAVCERKSDKSERYQSYIQAELFLICIIRKRLYPYNEKRYSKKENAFHQYFARPFKYTENIFHVIYTLIIVTHTGYNTSIGTYKTNITIQCNTTHISIRRFVV